MTYVIGKPCIDVCPVAAIHYLDDLHSARTRHLVDNEAFFTHTPAGSGRAVGIAGRGRQHRPLGVDTPLVAGQPRADNALGA